MADTEAPEKARVIDAETRRSTEVLDKGDVLLLSGTYYEVSAVIATNSGMANVYKIFDPQGGASWLLKEVSLSVEDNSHHSVLNREALVKEHETLRALNNPNIPRVLDIVKFGDFAYIRMDFLENHQSLKNVWDHKVAALTELHNKMYDEYASKNKGVVDKYYKNTLSKDRYEQVMRKKTDEGIPIVRITRKNAQTGDKTVSTEPWRNVPAVHREISGLVIARAKEEGIFYNTKSLVESMMSMCDVLNYLHNFKRTIRGEAGGFIEVNSPMVYRDLKPSNLMVSRNGELKLIDFGITRDLYSGERDKNGELVLDKRGEPLRNKTDLLCTKYYAPPEQQTPDQYLDIRSDIFSFGVTLFTMLSLKPPRELWDFYDKKTGKPLKGKISRKNRARADMRVKNLTYKDIAKMGNINDGVAKVIEKCIRPELDDRYNNASELKSALSLYKHTSDDALKKARKKVRKYRSVQGLAVVAGLGALASGYLGYQEMGNQYNNLLNRADQTSNTQVFGEAISIQPSNTEGYIQMLENQERKGSFDAEEESAILGIINPNLSKIENSEDYGYISYLIGKLYWTYYGDADEGKILAAPWLETAMNEGHDADGLTKVMFDTSDFYRSISFNQEQAQDEGQYSSYLERLQGNKETEMPQNVEIEFIKAYNNFISTYAYNLKMDGVSYTEVSDELAYLNDWANNTQGNSAQNNEEINKLSDSLSSTRVTVDSIYSN